jgi:NTE family protein
MKIGLALGGGGVRGFAHVMVLKALDDLELKPSMIAGTSMGAIIGAMYASGLSGNYLLEQLRDSSILKNDSWQDIYNKRDKLLEWLDVFTLERARGGMLKAEGMFQMLMDELKCTSFEELETPLTVIAADYWSAEEVIFNTGELQTAIQASMAVPGVFAPVSHEDRVLIDGGVVNLVPYDHVAPHCDVTLAVDVGGTRHPDETPVPNVMESLLGTIDIMQEAMLKNKLEQDPPDIYIQPDIRNVRMMDFTAIEEVFTQSKPAIDELVTKLKKLKREHSA